MRRFGFFVVVLPLVFASCETPVSFPPMPETDTSLFVDGDTVTFPRGAVALDIYNTVAYLFPDSGKWHDVTGTWNRIRTISVVDGLHQQTWESVPFTQIKHSTTAVRTHPNHVGYLYTHTVFLYGATTREIIFQRETFNATQARERRNDVIQGRIVFTLPSNP